MNKVLITGISGFAGSFLAEHLLTKNKEIYGTVLTNTSSENLREIQERVHLVNLDLKDFSAVYKIIDSIKPDIIFHLAALTSPAESYKNPSETINNNTAAEINILESVKNTKLLNTKILITSSAEVYGIVENGDLPIDENTPLNPISPYAVSKITQDFLGLQYFLTYKLKIIRVRPFNHIGPRQSPNFVVSSFSKKIAEIEKGKIEPVLRVGNINAERDFTDVRDMVRAYALIIEKGLPGDLYNIGSGKSYKIKDIIKTLLSYSDKKIDIEVDQNLLRPNDIEKFVCDNSKISKLTGWKPTINIEKTLKDTLDYWRKII